MAPNEVRCHNMMIRLYNMNVMSWNTDSFDGCILQHSFGYIPFSTFKKTLFMLTYLTRYT